MDIGRRIREIREDRGMPRSVLARRVGVAGNTLYLIERGDRTPSVALLERIARELHTEPAELLKEPAPLASAPQEPGQTEHKGPDEAEWGANANRPKPLPKSDVTHAVEVHDKIAVSDDVKAQLKPQFDALIYMLETSGLSKQAARARSLRDEVMAA